MQFLLRQGKIFDHRNLVMIDTLISEPNLQCLLCRHCFRLIETDQNWLRKFQNRLILLFFYSMIKSIFQNSKRNTSILRHLKLQMVTADSPNCNDCICQRLSQIIIFMFRPVIRHFAVQRMVYLVNAIDKLNNCTVWQHQTPLSHPVIHVVILIHPITLPFHQYLRLFCSTKKHHRHAFIHIRRLSLLLPV